MIEIREALPADVPDIARLHRAAFNATYPHFPVLHTQEEDVRHFEEVIQKNHVFVARVENRIVAYCAYTRGWLNYIYVDAGYVGKGIGTRLLDEAKKANSELQLWTFQVNKNARDFYERSGFVAVEETDGSHNEEKQPDVRYMWSQSPK